MSGYEGFGDSLRYLPRLRSSRRRRASSWDRSGGNDDRLNVEDPVTFERSFRVTIEQGPANKRSDDFSSVAYWYQAEPHRPFSIEPVERRLPRSG